MARSVSHNRLKCNIESNFAVAVAAFWVNFCILGVLRSNAVIFHALVDAFEINREDAAWPSGISGFFMCVTGALSGFLSHYISIRLLATFGCIVAALAVSICSCVSHMQHLILLYGALQGIGVGMIVPLTHVILNQNFTKYRAVALGIAYSGSSAGSFVFPPITNFLMSYYGLSGTFLLLGGIMLNAVLGTMFFRPTTKKTTDEPTKISQQSGNQHKNKERQFVDSDNCQQMQYVDDLRRIPQIYENSKNFEEVKTLKTCDNNLTAIHSGEETKSRRCLPNVILAMDVLTSPAFYIVSIAYAIYFSSSAIFLMVIIDYALDSGVPVHIGVYLVSAYSIGDLVGRLSCGWIADFQCIRRNTLVRLYLIVLGTLTALLPLVSFEALMVASIFLGIVNGAVIVNHSVLLNEYLDLEKLPVAMGFSTCFVGLSTFLRPIVIGIFRDNHQSYDSLFVSLGLLKIFVALLWFLETVPFVKRRCCIVDKTV
ncbi:monocarboxylate transporter 11-like [Uloborus diversus]|uniref:monocarboxylate transporter 11-like n=1 Tax=Uloborus diversus TaxID=327109 RepID=UPI00240A39A4|nr:monocarboxylate transporter 11-like [Uloborus diversus]